MKYLSHAFTKYVLTGSVAVTSEYASFLLLFYVLDVPLLVSNSVSFLAGLIASFLLNKLWTFKGKHQFSTPKQFVQFFALAMGNLLLANGFMQIFVVTLGLPGWIVKLLTMALVASWNFIIFKKVIFKAAKQSQAN